MLKRLWQWLRGDRPRLRAKYDAASSSGFNQQHWAGGTDTLDPNAANSETVRRRLRSRSRYEAGENNPILKGIVLSLANDFTGRGPMLQLTDRRLTAARAQFIEARFASWAKAIDLRAKLWRLRYAKCVDGEAFALSYTNQQAMHPVQLDYFVVEADQISTPTIGFAPRVREIDGIRFDEFDRPIEYHLLDVHPGSTLPFLSSAGGRWINRANVLHWFRAERGWQRGIPELTPCLQTCAILRRYTLAVLKAAEIAASFAGVVETEGPVLPNLDSDPDDLADWTIDPGTLSFLPRNMRLNQLKPEQPSGMYDGFVQSLLLEIARPLQVPHNRAIGSSKDSNMASAVVDDHLYQSAIAAERTDCEAKILMRILSAWWQEALRVPGYLDEPLAVTEGTAALDDSFAQTVAENPSLLEQPPAHYWRWDLAGLQHTNPQTVEQAWTTALESGQVSMRDVQEIRFNRDWQDHLRQLAREDEVMRDLGLGSGGRAARAPVAEDDSEEEDE